MRVATLFKRLLRLGRERVLGVEVVDDGGQEVLVVDVAARANRRMFCSGCGIRVRAAYDRQTVSWRHLDVMRTRCRLRCEIRRVDCPTCGVRHERVSWARAGSRFTRGFEDTCVFLARSAPKSVVAELMRIDWATVGRMITRVVNEHAATRGDDGLDGLTRIGLDEVAYRKGHRYLMCVVCHDTGRIVWAAEGRTQAVAAAFFTQLGPDRCNLIQAVSVDLHGGWEATIHDHCANAAICADPFHVVQLAGRALDTLRRAEWQRLREADPGRARWLKGTRFLLRRHPDTLSTRQRSILEDLAETNKDVYLGWLLTDQLKAVYTAQDHQEASRLLDDWIFAAATSGLEPFITVAITFERHAQAICNAVILGVNNARLEAMNSTVRLLSHRARGFRSLQSLLSLITLVCGRVPVHLPT